MAYLTLPDIETLTYEEGARAEAALLTIPDDLHGVAYAWKVCEAAATLGYLDKLPETYRETQRVSKQISDWFVALTTVPKV